LATADRGRQQRCIGEPPEGAEPPIVGERERCRVLAALAAVDAVVIFDEPTPLELIVAAQPDVIVKGGDYNPETVVGAREVQSWAARSKSSPPLRASPPPA